MNLMIIMRSLLALLVLAWPVHAQEPGRIYRIAAISMSAGSLEGIRRYTLPELARFGFVEGRNLVVEERNAEGDATRLRAFAGELARAQLDAIIAVSTIVIDAVREQAPRVPIVMSFASDDPVVAGFAATMVRPGGLITGISMLGTEGDAKRLELLRDAVPSVRKFGYLVANSADTDRRARAEAVAGALGLELVTVTASGLSEYPAALAALRAAGVGAVSIATYPVFARDAGPLSTMMTEAGLATICEWREMAREGCLLAYGPNIRELRRRTAQFVARILRGRAPGEMPIEQPNVYELTVNLRTAASLAIIVPRAILARADEVIE